LAFSPQGDLVASGNDHGKGFLWRVDDGTLVAQLDGHNTWLNSLAFSPDGNWLVSGSGDTTIRFWKTSDWQAGQELQSDDTVWSMAFSRDGQMLATGGSPYPLSYPNIQIWNVVNGTLLQTLKSPDPCPKPTTCGVSSLSFSPDGQLLASSNWKGHVYTWGIDSAALP